VSNLIQFVNYNTIQGRVEDTFRYFIMILRRIHAERSFTEVVAEIKIDSLRGKNVMNFVPFINRVQDKFKLTIN